MNDGSTVDPDGRPTRIAASGESATSPAEGGTLMDLSPFRPGFDAAGKRIRSLELYGLGTAFRRSDGFAESVDEIVRCAVRFVGAAGASIDVWPGEDPVNLAGPGSTAPGGPTPALDAAALTRVWETAPDRAVAFPFDSSAPGRPDLTCWAVPLVGRERVALGLVTVWDAAPWHLGPDERLLLTHLAGAVVGVLDRQRRVRQRRARPAQPPLRAVDAPDRRRDDEGWDA